MAETLPSLGRFIESNSICQQTFGAAGRQLVAEKAVDRVAWYLDRGRDLIHGHTDATLPFQPDDVAALSASSAWVQACACVVKVWIDMGLRLGCFSVWPSRYAYFFAP